MLAQAASLLMYVLCNTRALYGAPPLSDPPHECPLDDASMRAGAPSALTAILAAVGVMSALGSWVVAKYGFLHSGVRVPVRGAIRAETTHPSQLQRGASSALAAAALVLALGVCFVLIERATGCNGALWLVKFALTPLHCCVMAWWAAVLLCVVPFVHVAKKRSAASSVRAVVRKGAVPKIVVRKAFHAVAILLFLPAILLDLHFTAIACAGALLVLLCVDFLRAVRAPLVGGALHRYMVQFTDERDTGALILTHVYLLVGCATPMWAAVALEASGMHLGSVSQALLAAGGLVSVGVGDSAAAVVGTLYGSTRWPGSRKTVQGTAAAAASMFLCTALLQAALSWGGAGGGGGLFLSGAGLPQLAALAAFIAAVETFCDTSDNLLLPLQWVFAVWFLAVGS